MFRIGETGANRCGRVAAHTTNTSSSSPAANLVGQKEGQHCDRKSAGLNAPRFFVSLEQLGPWRALDGFSLPLSKCLVESPEGLQGDASGSGCSEAQRKKKPANRHHTNSMPGGK
jgi:hypothetical protein